jgi:hypothetical protein
MKHFIFAMLMVFMCTVCGHDAFAKETSSRLADKESEESDLVPWPWGTECLFPWNKVEGEWSVKGSYGSRYDRHRMVFEAAEDVSADGVKLLYIKHFNRGGKLVGEGTGYANPENKIIKAVMTDLTGVTTGYQVIVRSYARAQGASCRRGKLAVAATFCPRNSRRCLENPNYLLEK